MHNQKIISSFIRKRGDNFNLIVEYIDESGKNRQKSKAKYTNKKDADKALIDLKSSINNNKYVIGKDIKFTDRYKQYIEDENKHLSPTTVKSRYTILNTNIIPFFKDTKLEDINTKMLQKYVNKMYKDYTKEAAKHRYACVRTVLTECYKLREINENPCDFIIIPKNKINNISNRAVQEPYTREEVKKIITNLEGELIEIPILLMLTMGLRYSEMAGLRWEDVDFENKSLTVRQILILDQKNNIAFKEPKTQGSIRTVSIPDELIEKLDAWKVKYESQLKDIVEYKGIICLNSKLLPWHGSNLLINFKKFVTKLGIRKLRLHDLRHTHATMLVLAGIDFKTISSRLGHTDIKITLNRYSHVLEEMDRKASDSISNIMFK